MCFGIISVPEETTLSRSRLLLILSVREMKLHASREFATHLAGVAIIFHRSNQCARASILRPNALRVLPMSKPNDYCAKGRRRQRFAFGIEKSLKNKVC